MKKTVLVSLLALSACGQKLAECSGPSYALNGPNVQPQVWDDGSTTFIKLPGHTGAPAPFIVRADGKEASTDFSVSGDTMSIPRTAKEIRLRDGDSVRVPH